MHSLEAVVRCARLPERDGLVVSRTEPGRVRVVGAKKDFPLGVIKELLESALNRGKVRVVVEVLLLDIQDERVLWVVAYNGAVALVCLRDEVLALWIPVGVYTENRNLRSHVVRGMHATLAEHVRPHGTRRRLAVHAGNYDSFLEAHDGGKRIGAAHHRQTGGPGGIEIRVTRLDGGRIDHEFRRAGLYGIGRSGKIEAERLQALRLHGHGLVGAAHTVAQGNAQPRDAAHPRPGNADQVDAVRACGKKLSQLGAVHCHL